MHRSIEMGNVALPLGIAGNNSYQGGDLIVQPVDRPPIPIPIAVAERIDAPERPGLADVRRLARRDYGGNCCRHFSNWLGAHGVITQLLQEAFPNDRQFVERACSGSVRARSMLYLMVHNRELTPEQILDWLTSRTLPGASNGDDLIFGAPLDSYWLHQAQTDVQVVDELARIGALRQEEPSVSELLQVFEQTEGNIEEKLAALEALARQRNMSELAMAEAFYLLAASCHFGQFLQASGVNRASILTMLRYSDRYRIPPEAAPEVRAGIERELESRATVLWQNMSGLTSDDALVVAKRMVARRWNNQPLIRERLASRFCALLNLIRTDDRASGLAASWMSTVLQHLQLTARHISLPRDKQLAQVLVNCLFQYGFGEYGPEGSDIHFGVARMVQVYMRDWHVYPDALISEERVLRLIRDRIFLLEPDTIKDWIQRQPDSLFVQTIATHYCSPREVVETIDQSRKKKPKLAEVPCYNKRTAELLYQPLVMYRSRPGTRSVDVFCDDARNDNANKALSNELMPVGIRINIGSRSGYPPLERMAANDRMPLAEKLPLMRRYLSSPSYDNALPRWLTRLVLPKDWTIPGELAAARELVELMVGRRNFAVRGRASEFLAEMLSDSHLPPAEVAWGKALFARLAADTKVTVRRDAARSSRSLVSQESVPVAVRTWAIGVLRSLTTDVAADVRVDTVAVLASVLSNPHLPLAEHQVARDLMNAVIALRDPELTETAASLLGPIVRNEHVDRGVRRWARNHINVLSPAHLAVHEARHRQHSVEDCYGPMLINAGLDMDERMWALRRLRSLAGDPDASVRRETVGWFGTLANGANYLPPDRLLARDHFRFLIGDGNNQVVLRLVTELGRIGSNVVDIHPEDRALFMPMLQELIRHGDVDVRVAVAEELGRLVQKAGLTEPELQAAREGLLALAGDADAKVRLKVAEILGRAANNVDVQPEDRVWTRPALDHLSQDPNNDICGRVMQDLLRIAGNVVHDRESNIPPEERAWATVVVNHFALVARLPGREVVLAKMAPLWLAMVNDGGLEIDERLWALGKLRELSTELRLPARLAAIRALTDVASNALLPPELALRGMARDCLDGAMTAPVAEVRREVAIGYGLIVANGHLLEEERQPVLAIIEMLANDAGHPDLRILGVLALSKVASGRAAPKVAREWAQRHLARLAQDKDPEVRSAVAAALTPMATTMIGAGTPDNNNVGERANARAWLSRLTRDKSDKVRLATIDAFGQVAWTMFDPEERVLPIAERAAAMDNLYLLEKDKSEVVKRSASSRRHEILSVAPHAYEE